jgi:hypothetical protein
VILTVCVTPDGSVNESWQERAVSTPFIKWESKAKIKGSGGLVTSQGLNQLANSGQQVSRLEEMRWSRVAQNAVPVSRIRTRTLKSLCPAETAVTNCALYGRVAYSLTMLTAWKGFGLGHCCVPPN